MNQDIVFLSGKRTPFGAFNGALAEVSATDLGVHAGRAALEAAGVRPDQVDHVIFGNVVQSSPDAIYCARHIGLKLGVPQAVPALTVNRLCGSGFESVVQAAHLLLLGHARVVLAGGTENMSQAPHVLRGARKGFKLGGAPLGDMLQEALYDPQAGCAMGITAENLAEKYSITREEADDYGYRSQTAWATAHAEGRYTAELAPVVLKDRKGVETVVSIDEHPQLSPLAPEKNRLRFSREAMAKLSPVFKKDGTVTAANASGINDGAAALVLSTMAHAHEQGLQPIGRLISWGVAGVDPRIMGIGPVDAIRKALAMAGMGLDAMDLVEVNEAFSTQVLACERELAPRREVFNVNSGGVAVGHPLGASGARITAHLLHELRRRGGRYGVGSACIGGGQGIALVVEAL